MRFLVAGPPPCSGPRFPSLAPELRLASLRRLEAAGPAAVPVAQALAAAGSDEGLLRLNALAVLARSSEPSARDALASLPPADRALAERTAAAPAAEGR